MGCDIIGWRDCALQKKLGPAGFLAKLKLRAAKSAVEAQVPEARRATIEIRFEVPGRPLQQLRYPDICREVQSFAKGIPACARCPLAGGAPLGCYRFVAYPIDEVGERVIFEFFVEGLAVEDSITQQLWSAVVSHVPADTAWATARGPSGPLAALRRPLVHEWREGRAKRRVDSAQLLAALFITLDEVGVLVAYARFWVELRAYVARRVQAAGVRVGEDGEVAIHVKGRSVRGVARKAASQLASAGAIASSRTLRDLDGVAQMFAELAPRAVDRGWSVVVDG